MKKTKAGLLIIVSTFSLLAGTCIGCSTFKSVFGRDTSGDRLPPIQNPFGDFNPNNRSNENIVLRTKKGDRSVEVELPGGTANMTDFVVPVSPAFGSSRDGRNPASSSGTAEDNDDTWRARRPGLSDREITHTFPKGQREDEGDRREVESGLGLMASEDSTPDADQSYLAQMDQVKQLYKKARYEAALMEVDDMVRSYPTDPKLYQMRGTLLERVGRSDLALRSWNQALRFDPDNQSLRRFIERKQQKRGLATDGGQP